MGISPAIATVLAEVGPRLERVRTRRGVTLTELAAETGISKSTLSRLGPGEVAEFDTSLPHWFGTARDEPVEILSLLGRHAEHAHVRPAPRRKGNGS